MNNRHISSGAGQKTRSITLIASGCLALVAWLLSVGVTADEPTAENIATIKDVLMNIEENLQNVALAFRYQHMLPVEPENPWTSNSRFVGSSRKMGVYCQVGRRKLLEQVSWRYYAIEDNSSVHEICYYDGEKTYTWSGWNNSGRTRSGEDSTLFGMGLIVGLYLYASSNMPLSQEVSRCVVTAVTQSVSVEGELMLAFDLKETSPPENTAHIVLSGAHDFLPVLIQRFSFKDGHLLTELKVTEFMPLPEQSGVTLRWFPKRASHRNTVPVSFLGGPTPPVEVEVLSVVVGALKPEDLAPFAYPRGCLLGDEDTRTGQLPEEGHILPYKLDASELPSYFSKLPVQITLAEAKEWVENHH